MTRLVIVGLGSPHGDDQAGWLAVERLGPHVPPDKGISVHKVSGGFDVLDCLDARDAALVIDAAAPAGRPGLIRTFAWPCPELAASVPWSTHGLGLVEAFELAAVLGRLPARVRIYTIEAHHTAPGTGMSRPILRSLDTLVEMVLREVIGYIT